MYAIDELRSQLHKFQIYEKLMEYIFNLSVVVIVMSKLPLKVITDMPHFILNILKPSGTTYLLYCI